MTTNVYHLGDTVRLRGVFRNTAGALADPVEVRCWVTDPDGETTEYEYPADAELEKDTTGTFHLDVVANLPFRWKYQFQGSGNNIEMVEPSFFDVEPSAFA